LEKPKLSFWQIWNMSFGFLGIQFGFALQNANVSRIFETLGANIDEIPILWIAAPVTGLIIQPIIGHNIWKGRSNNRSCSYKKTLRGESGGSLFRGQHISDKSPKWLH